MKRTHSRDSSSHTEQREEAFDLVLKVLHTVESWVQTLQQEETELAQLFLEIARLREFLRGYEPTLCSLLGLHGVKWLCLFCGQQEVLRTHCTIPIVRTQPCGQKVR